MKQLPGLVTACNILSKYRGKVSKSAMKPISSFVLICEAKQYYLLHQAKLLPPSTHIQFMRNSYQFTLSYF